MGHRPVSVQCLTWSEESPTCCSLTFSRALLSCSAAVSVAVPPSGLRLRNSSDAAVSMSALSISWLEHCTRSSWRFLTIPDEIQKSPLTRPKMCECTRARTDPILGAFAVYWATNRSHQIYCLLDLRWRIFCVHKTQPKYFPDLPSQFRMLIVIVVAWLPHFVWILTPAVGLSGS